MNYIISIASNGRPKVVVFGGGLQHTLNPFFFFSLHPTELQCPLSRKASMRVCLCTRICAKCKRKPRR